ncbi:MAG: prenyltransferase/squalene oxidase repeat-containing protein, partial [Promethearchaeota archaeon]
MTIIKGKTAYPYLSFFKKEPFESFTLIKQRNINDFYTSNKERIIKFYDHFQENLFKYQNLNLENIYWFLLLNKYLKQPDPLNAEQIYEFIKKCERIKENKLGFKFTPTTEYEPDIWSTYYAFMSFHFLGLLDDYLFSRGLEQTITFIKDFIFSHSKGTRFLHCLDAHCEIENDISPARTLYFILEIFSLLELDIRGNREKFRPFIGVRRKDPSLVFKLSCLLYLDLASNVKEKEILYLYQFQRKNGGFNFKEGIGNSSTTFWITWVLYNYSWLVDYDPSRIYSFIINRLNNLMKKEEEWNLTILAEVSKLIITLSLIWKKFINEIERVVFDEVEKNKFIDLNRIEAIFGLDTATIQEIISYINDSYNFNLRILTMKSEFSKFVNELSANMKLLATTLYEEISKNSVIYISDILKKYNTKFRSEQLKIKDVDTLLKKMISHHFFNGTLRKKRTLLSRVKYFFYVSQVPEHVIVSDIDINAEKIFEEKLKLKEIKNDIYNIILNLKNATSQIKEEIESYLMMDEVEYAKKRLSLITRSKLMDADFLNENIENSFNEELYYMNIQSVLAAEISRWKELYSVLSLRLNETEKYLKEKIKEKEELKNYELLLDKLEEKIFAAAEAFNKYIKAFRIFLRTILEQQQAEKVYDTIMKEFNTLKGKVEMFDEKIQRFSQKIITKEDMIRKKHKNIIEKWLGIKEELDMILNYYSEGFSFFNQVMVELAHLERELEDRLSEIHDQASQKIYGSEFKIAYEIIQNQSDLILQELPVKLKSLKTTVEGEIKKKQKLYLLYRYLNENIDKMEERYIKKVGDRVQALRDK